MAKAKLTDEQERELLQTMKQFQETLERVGIAGTAFVTFEGDGDMSGEFAVDDKTTLHIRVTEDECTKTISYR